MKKKALIVFPDFWISYAPSILNMMECLKHEYNISVITFDIPHLIHNNYNDNCVKFIKIGKLLYKILRKIKFLKIYRIVLTFMELIKKKISDGKFDLVIGVDSIGYIPSKLLFKDTIYMSLEIRKDVFFIISKFLCIKYLIIQSQARKKYLFGSKKITTFYIQNSPIIHQDNIKLNKSNNEIIYFGNIVKEHGVELCIESLLLIDKKFCLTLKGIIDDNYKECLCEKYKSLFLEKRLVIDETYTAQDDVTNYLAKFYIGFCLYDFTKINQNDFNYISCPSGKLFNYYAAGVPVIGNDIIGLSSIKDMKTGIVIRELSVHAIANAVVAIDKSFNQFSDNAIRASKDFDFKRSYDKFIKEFQTYHKKEE